MAAYFNEPDNSGHKGGPDTEQVGGIICTPTNLECSFVPSTSTP